MRLMISRNVWKHMECRSVAEDEKMGQMSSSCAFLTMPFICSNCCHYKKCSNALKTLLESPATKKVANQVSSEKTKLGELLGISLAGEVELAHATHR
jgi:hypothetical protein